MTHLEEVVGGARIALKCGAAGEVASPEGVFAVRVGEEVIGLRRVRHVRLVQRPQVARRGRVEHVHLATACLLHTEGISYILVSIE